MNTVDETMSVPGEAMTEPVLEVEGLRTHFFTKAGVVKAVDDVSFTVGRGEVLGLVGESGSGKSMTGYSLMGLIDSPGRIVAGSIVLDGIDLRTLDAERQRQLRGNRIAMIFQDPMMTLNPVLRVDTQMIEAVRAHHDVSRHEARERARAALIEARQGAEKADRVRMLREAKKLLHGSPLDHLPRIHDHRAVADRGGELEVVGDEQHRQPKLRSKIVEDREHLSLRRDIERGGGLVGKQESRLCEQRRGDHDALEQAPRQLMWVLAQPALAILDADAFEQSHSPPRSLPHPHSRGGAQRLGHEIPDPAHWVGVGPGVLKDHRDLAPEPLEVTAGQRHDVPAVEPHTPGYCRPVRQELVDGPRRHRLA